jgi:MDMPI C-terminal domain
MERLNGAVEMRLEGPRGRTLRIGGGDVGACITSDSEAFVRWVTQRGSWEDLGVKADGDPSDLELMRQLTVY